MLLGQLGANGDCVYATTVARQIKHDDPDCHLTWAIGSMCLQVIAHNPHVDDVWEVEYRRREQMPEVWAAFARDARQRQRRGDFDDVYLTQIYPSNFQNFDGTVRASIFRGYPRPITVSAQPVIRLDRSEVERVAAFAAQNGLTRGGPAIIFEAEARSGQSPMAIGWAYRMARLVLDALPDYKVVLTSGFDPSLDNRGIVDAGALRFREIAELARYCSLFVGCSSGVTWLLTSDAAPVVPMVQVLSSKVGEYGAVVSDLEYWRLPSAHVVELHDCSPQLARDCVLSVVRDGVAVARARYHEVLPLRFDHYFDIIFPFLRDRNIRVFAGSVRNTVKRYGLRRVMTPDFLRRATLSMRGR